MATNYATDQTNDPRRQSDGAPGATHPSDRDLRAIRRCMGVPVVNTPEREFLTQRGDLSKRKMDSDTEFDEVSSSDEYSTSDDEFYANDDRRVNRRANVPVRATPTGVRTNNVTLLQDSKFSADRTDMRLWHELRYVRSVWSREEDDQLREDCLVITDGDELQSTSNSLLWTASFDRYGVPLSDIFTYGLRPHPGNLRLSRKKLLSPQFCDHLTGVLIHPIFQGDAALVRYVLQLIVRMRVGIHVPPMGTMPDMDDTSLDQVKWLADTLLLEEETPDSRMLVHADAYLFISQKQGARFHPDIVMLEDRLIVNFAIEGHEHTAPRDDAPNSRSLFYLQLWDLQFLVNVLNDLSFSSSYLTVERYKAWWLKDTHRIHRYVANKLDSLVQQWFLSDERNYRIRQKLKQEGPEKRLYDIPEEDFSPTYARSQYVTHKMRSVLEGEYLEALCPPGRPWRHAEVPVVQGPVAVREEEQEPGSGTDSTQLTFNLADSPGRTPMRSPEEEGTDPEQLSFNLIDSPGRTPMRSPEDDGTGAGIIAHIGQKAAPEAELNFDAQTGSNEKTDDQTGDYGRAYDGDVEESEDDKDQARSHRHTSFVSVQSVASSKAADDQQHSPCSNSPFARRGLPPPHKN